MDRTDDQVEGLLREQDGGVLTITLNRPEKLNAIRWDMVGGITRWVDEAGRDESVRVIKITGAGRAFSSGDDIVGGMGGDFPTDLAGRLARTTGERGMHYDMVNTFLRTPKPIVAAINGRCHGAGWVIALSCDLRVARADVLIGDIRSQKAIFANQGVGLLLPRLIGQSRAMDMLMTGRVIDAAEAERYGILNRVFEADTWEKDVAELIGELAEGPTRTYAAWKASVNRAVLLEHDAYTDHERLLNAALLGSADNAEGVQAFKERRPPRFTGR